jgi:hypothetical protein
MKPLRTKVRCHPNALERLTSYDGIMSERVHIFCPDFNKPSGGIRQMYRMTDLLNSIGYRASIVHRSRQSAPMPFAHSTPVEYRPEIQFSPDDWIVLPEIWAYELAPRLPGLRKVIFNQNAYYTFAGSTLKPDNVYCPYTDPEVKATIVISDDSAQYLAHAFPGAKILRHFYNYDPQGLLHFVPHDQKKARIAFMPRKNSDYALQVFQILHFRKAMKGWEVQSIDDMPPEAVAAALQQAAVFFSFGYPEGCPFPPAEAMLCGCAVVGYHGNGGSEYFTADRGFPVEVGQIVKFAEVAESVLLRWHRDRTPFAKISLQASDYIRATYNAQAERASMEDICRKVFASH